MSIELTMLACTAVLCLMLPGAYFWGWMQTPGGLQWSLSNRDKALDSAAPWIGRAQRAHANLVENLGPFAVLVLVAYVAGRLSWLTGVGAVVFFVARVAHAFVYIAGITGLRSLLFFVGLFGEIMIVLQLLF